jgi:hypothetical protein
MDTVRTDGAEEENQMKMDQATYERWRPLHVRFAKGEALDPEERAFYDAVCRQLDEEEVLGQDLDAKLAQTRAKIAALEKERAALEARRHDLEEKIATLETALAERLGHPLGAKG